MTLSCTQLKGRRASTGPALPMSGSVASCLSRGPASGPLSPTPAEQPSASHESSRPEAFPQQAAGRPGRAPRHGNGRCSPLLPLRVGEELMGPVRLPCRGPSATSQRLPLHALAELALCPTSSCCTKGHRAGRKRERAGPAGNAAAEMITEPWRPSFFPPPPTAGPTPSPAKASSCTSWAHSS